MKLKIFSAVLFFACSLFALSDVTVPNTFVDSAIIEAADFNQNFDTLEAWVARTNDSLDAKFIRFTDFTSHDTTLKFLRVDTIRSNPDIDSIKGLNVMRGNPNIDSISGLNVMRGNPNIDSISGPTKMSNLVTVDSIRIATSGSFLVAFTETSCSAPETLLITYQVIDSLVFLNIPYTGGVNRGFCGLCCASDTSNTKIAPVTEFPYQIIPTVDPQNISCMVTNNNNIFPGFISWVPGDNIWVLYTLRDGSGASVSGLDYTRFFKESGNKGLNAQTIIYKR